MPRSKNPEVTAAKIRAARTGKRHSAETREKISRSLRVRSIERAMYGAVTQHPELLKDPADDTPAGT